MVGRIANGPWLRPWGAALALAALFPLLRVALEGFTPWQIVFGSVLGAALPAFLLLSHYESPLPKRRQLLPLALMAAGGLMGFPLLAAAVLKGDGLISGALATAAIPLLAVSRLRCCQGLRACLRSRVWLVTTAVFVTSGFLLVGIGQTALILTTAVALAIAIGQGHLLKREIPGWRALAWALMLAAPASALGFGYSWAQPPAATSAAHWIALGLLMALMPLGCLGFGYDLTVIRKNEMRIVVFVPPLLVLLLSAVLPW